MTVERINPTTDVSLRGLYQRNISLMSQTRMRPLNIRALWWGRYRMLKQWRIIPNVHYASWRMHWNDRPGGTLIFRGEEYALSPDRVVAIPPHTPVSARLDNPVMHFNINFLLGHPHDNVSSVLLAAPLDNQLRSIMEELTEIDCTGELTPYQTINLQVMIGLLLRQIPADGLGPQPKDGRIRQILELINEDPNLSNSELADIAGMSTNGFHRLFKEQVGVTPHAYVLGRKMDLACSLLLHTDNTVDAIAAECGFNDRAYFARAFRRQFTMSPSEYRTQHSG